MQQILTFILTFDEGVDFILDCSNSLCGEPNAEESRQQSSNLTTRTAVNLLAAHGVWVTGTNVFLSPSDCQILHRKSASISFLFEQV